MSSPKPFDLALVIDDDEDILLAARILLRDLFADVAVATSPEAAMPVMVRSPEVVLLDANFARGATNGAEGFRWLEEILKQDSDAIVVMITAHGGVQIAVEAMKRGATDFVSKPWNNDRLLTIVRTAANLRRSRRQGGGAPAKSSAPAGAASAALLGDSPGMRRVQSLIARAGPTQANVLILGENGTGKELVARALHEASGRAAQSLVSVDLGAVAETLFDSELFGHVKGAFTDARADAVGRLRAANGATLFLDEVGNLPLHLQPKLLTALEQRRVTPVGSGRSEAIDVRVISATNLDHQRLIDERVFRQDLLFRLNTVEIELPSLRTRREDIPTLLDHFLRDYERRYSTPRRNLAEGVLGRLVAHDWPGNVRALRHAAERAVILASGSFYELDDFPLGRAQSSEPQCLRSTLRQPTSTLRGWSATLSNMPCVSTVITSRILQARWGFRVPRSIAGWKSMASNRGTVRLAAHLLALLTACATMVWTLQRPDSLVLSILALAATTAVIVSLYQSMRRHDRELVRFIEAIGHLDLSQRFGDGAIGTALDAAMRRLSADRQRIGEEAQFQAAMIEETPVALLTVGQDRKITLLNAAARGLFEHLDGQPVDAFASQSAALVGALDPVTRQLGRSLISVSAAGGDHRALVTITEMRRAGRPLRLVSVEPIGRELDAAEVAAQADLVRVLTHEIMNSLTPVTSLAQSAAALMARVPDDDEFIRDARRAIQIVADRAAGLLGFVDSYRQYATLPIVVHQSCDARRWGDGVIALFGEATFGRDVRVVIEVVPPTATFVADPDLLTQALLNLLKNAAEAGAGHVQLTIRNHEDRVDLMVADNGAGFGADVAVDMFLPFFTSKSTGTGIGLSLARQVAVAHGGSISAHVGDMGGAVFLISIPQ